jgi:hypothetical protein
MKINNYKSQIKFDKISLDGSILKRSANMESVKMKFAHIYVFVVILAIVFSGCKSGSPEIPAIETPASISKDGNLQEEVIVKALYEKPLSLENKNTILLEGLIEGEEYIEIVVRGEIFDFEQVELIWDEEENDLKEKETVKRIEKLKDQTIVIKTYQPEGIPTEKIKWKSRSGKTYEYIICERSLGDIDNSVSKFEMK